MDEFYNTTISFLTIRFSDEEHYALTKLRGSYEFYDGKNRWTIRDLITKVIEDSVVLHKEGKLLLPIFHDLGEVSNKHQMSLKKTAEESQALSILSKNINGQEIQYGQADLVRVLLKKAQDVRFKDLEEKVEIDFMKKFKLFYKPVS